MCDAAGPHALGSMARAVVALGCLVVAAGCQYNTAIGAVNRCGEPVEADVVAQRESTDDGPAGEILEPGERDYVRSVPESTDTVYVMVRRADGGRVLTRSVPVAESAEPPDGEDYDREVVLTGGLCPA